MKGVTNFGIVDLRGLNLKEMTREIGEERAEEMLKIIVENNTKILELQSILISLIKNEKKKERRIKRNEKERVQGRGGIKKIKVEGGRRKKKKSRSNKSKRREEGRKEMETIRNVKEKKRREEIENNGRKKMFGVWRL